MKDIIKNLRSFLEAARLAVSMAKIENPTARGMAGVGWKLPDGVGKLVCDFDSEPFCDDLERVLDAYTKNETALTRVWRAIGMQRNPPEGDKIAEAMQRAHLRKVIEAHLQGAEAMRAACRAVADDSREAIDALPLPEFTEAAIDTEWRDRPPTLAEVKALAKTFECNVWSGETQWMILQPTDQTVMVEIVSIRETTYEADIKYAMDQGACSFRPVTIDGDRYPWPVVA